MPLQVTALGAAVPYEALCECVAERPRLVEPGVEHRTREPEELRALDAPVLHALNAVVRGELFAEGLDSLLIYGFMFGPDMDDACPMCTAFLDSLNGTMYCCVRDY